MMRSKFHCPMGETNVWERSVLSTERASDRARGQKPRRSLEPEAARPHTQSDHQSLKRCWSIWSRSPSAASFSASLAARQTETAFIRGGSTRPIASSSPAASEASQGSDDLSSTRPLDWCVAVVADLRPADKPDACVGVRAQANLVKRPDPRPDSQARPQAPTVTRTAGDQTDPNHRRRARALRARGLPTSRPACRRARRRRRPGGRRPAAEVPGTGHPRPAARSGRRPRQPGGAMSPRRRRAEEDRGPSTTTSRRRADARADARARPQATPPRRPIPPPRDERARVLPDGASARRLHGRRAWPSRRGPAGPYDRIEVPAAVAGAALLALCGVFAVWLIAADRAAQGGL